jgi:acyl-CoA reductase-like NAD-dependent aldehyde dehydrogenase
MTDQRRARAEPRLPPLDLFVGGEWRQAASGRRRPISNPVDGRAIAEVAESDPRDIDAPMRTGQEYRDQARLRLDPPPGSPR